VAPSENEASLAMTGLAMTSPGNKVTLKVKDRTLTRGYRQRPSGPLERVKVEGGGLKVLNAQGDVVGSMAQLPKDGPAALKASQHAPNMGKVDVFTDNPDLEVRILNNRELSVRYRGQHVPAGRISMENGELRIFNAAGDLLRIIPADSSRLTKRAQER